jgi:hypothetical protein
MLLGQLSVLSRPDHHDVLAKWARKFGGIYRMRLAHINVGTYNQFFCQCTESPVVYGTLACEGSPGPVKMLLRVPGPLQAVVVTDPYLVSDVLNKDVEIEKSIEGVYSKFNVVRR